MTGLDAKFSKTEDGKLLLALSGGYLGKDEVVRIASEQDKVQFEDAYKAFLAPPPPDKDAQIKALQDELAALKAKAK